MNFSDESNKNFTDFSALYEEQLQSVSLPAKLAGSFTLKNCLKHSGHREIYLLADKTGTLYILKKTSGKQLPQLKQERHIFEILKDIKDLAIPRYIDCWEEQGCCYLLRTYIEGCSLSDYFNHRLYLSDMEIIHYMLAICDLISTLHHQHPPIIHRDIKPENFIIQKGTGILYLVDFDTARVYTPDKSRDTMLVGTPSHAAPEQFGFSQSDVRTDIYALGKTLLYLTYGNTEITDLKSSSIAKPFQKMITHCTDFTPDKRYSDINQLIRSLKHYQRHLNFSRSYARQIGTSILLLAFGIFLGYITGSIQGKQNLTDYIHTDNNINTSSQEDNNPADTTDLNKADNASTKNSTSTENDTEQTKNDSSDETTSVKSPVEVSLLEQSGVLECDLLQFQDMVNQIILDYYKSDPDAMVKDYEILTNALYQDEALNQITGTDYGDFDEAPDSIFQAPIVRIRDLLAYRNQILKRYQGSYDSYKDAIFMSMNGYLDSQTANTECALYLYATSSDEEAVDNNYQHALADVLYSLINSFNMVDEAEDTQPD